MYIKEGIINNQNSICKGKIYKAIINNYINSKGEYINQVRMIPLKRKSCPGCLYCNGITESLRGISDIDNYLLPTISHVEHGKLYSLNIVNEHYDFENGIVDDWDLEFIEINEIE